MTLKEIAFVKEGIQAPPSASALTIDFEAETVSFEGEIEVFATKEEDGTLSDPIASGTAVTPGSTLWMRTKAGDSPSCKRSGGICRSRAAANRGTHARYGHGQHDCIQSGGL